MEKNTAKNLVKEALQNPFNKERFGYLVKNLVNKLDESKSFELSGQYVKEIFRDYVKSYERLGTYTDPENKKIDILIVNLQKETSLERARTAQRNFIARYLKDRGEKDAGLVAYVSPDPSDWRFSFVKMEYKYNDEKKKIDEEFTPARRFSFLVGQNENSHTAQSRLLPLLLDDETLPTLEVLEDAFNVEKVTKEFFEKYRDLYLRLKEALDETLKSNKKIREDFKEKSVDVIDFSKKLLGQIVFLYFLQKKGWFGVARDNDWGTGPKNFLRQLFEQKHGNYKNFFNEILEPLFYEALAKERDDDFYSKFNCKIPFLNGGLFDPINNYDWVHTDILLPNDLYSNNRKTKEGDEGDGILDIFDRYNFTVKEDEPLEKEVAIDPEMLGKVFENLLEVKDRKSKGTYYTPREIVHYMCVQSLTAYLVTALEGKVSKEDFEKLIKYGDSVGENETHVEEKGEETYTYYYKMPESIRANAKSIDEKLSGIKICDPAIGSGAFLVGMMTEIVRVRNVLTSYINGNDRTFYNFKRTCIQDSLYGVDIDPSAVEIAKLRLWLSLVVDEEDMKRIKPLPNLDYKIMQGNSLLEEYEGVQLFDEKLFSGSNFDDKDLLAELKERQAALSKKYINLHQENKLNRIEKLKMTEELKMLDSQIKKTGNATKDFKDGGTLFDVYSEAKKKSNDLKRLHKEFFETTSKKKKDELKKEVEALEWDLIETTLKEKGKTSEIKILTELKKTKVRPFFLWKLHFADVFQNGGFDVVIANPPYVDSEQMTREDAKNREKLASKYKTTKGNWDLYIPFWEVSLNLTKAQGCAHLITPNKWLAIDYGQSLRELILPYINMVADYSRYRAFQNVGVFAVAVMAIKQTNKMLMVKSYSDTETLAHQQNIPKTVLTGFGNWGLILSKNLPLVLKLVTSNEKLKTFCNFQSAFSVSEAYELVSCISEFKKGEKNYLKFVNTGTIDPYVCLWEVNQTTYIKRKYEKPIVSKSVFGKKFPRRYEVALKPKLIISGMRHFEAFFDQVGECLPGKSTVVGFPVESKISEKYLLALLNSFVPKFFFKECYGALAMDGGITFTNKNCGEIPIPKVLNKIKQIEVLVDQILDKKKNDVEADIEGLKDEINQMFYNLYRLAPEEIEIIKTIV